MIVDLFELKVIDTFKELKEWASQFNTFKDRCYDD